jgi:hypothetical protein
VYAAETSFMIRCWREAHRSLISVQVLRSDGAQEVLLKDALFLLRFWVEGEQQVERCQIRHIESGREAYIQSGASLRAFLHDCLLAPHTPETLE